MMTTLATKYNVKRDPKSEYSELAGVRNIIISEEQEDGNRYYLCVWGNGIPVEQEFENAPSVREYQEVGSVVADLGAIGEAISDNSYAAWINSHQDHNGSPSRTVASMAKDLCAEFVLNKIEKAEGVIDITEEVIEDAKQEED